MGLLVRCDYGDCWRRESVVVDSEGDYGDYDLRLAGWTFYPDLCPEHSVFTEDYRYCERLNAPAAYLEARRAEANRLYRPGDIGALVMDAYKAALQQHLIQSFGALSKFHQIAESKDMMPGTTVGLHVVD